MPGIKFLVNGKNRYAGPEQAKFSVCLQSSVPSVSLHDYAFSLGSKMWFKYQNFLVKWSRAVRKFINRALKITRIASRIILLPDYVRASLSRISPGLKIIRDFR